MKNSLYRTLPDVNMAGLANGDLATYNATTGKWLPITRAALATALGVSSVGNFFVGTGLIATVNNGDPANFAWTEVFNEGYTVVGDSITFPAVGDYLINVDLPRQGSFATASLSATGAIASIAGKANALAQIQQNLTAQYLQTNAGPTATASLFPVNVSNFFRVTTVVADNFQLQFNNDLGFTATNINCNISICRLRSS